VHSGASESAEAREALPNTDVSRCELAPSLSWRLRVSATDKNDLGKDATIGRTCYHARVHMAILRVCDMCALDAPDRSALTVRHDLLLMDSFALCLYDTRSVVVYVHEGPQEMTSYDVMAGRLLYGKRGVMPRGVVYLNCTKVALRPQSQLGL
jgi:hypothetical protein